MQLSGLRILLGEDNPTNRLVTVQMLEGLGAEVAVARDGRETLAVLSRERFDVLLIDIEMPHTSGLEVIRSLAADPRRYGAMTTIALTAYATRDLAVELGRAGAAGVITKPVVSIDRFGAEIAATIRRHRDGETASGEVARIDRGAYEALAAAVGESALGELLGKVDGDIAGAYDRMARAISKCDMSELRAATHILMSVAGAIGAVGLQELSQRLNRAAHEHDEPAVRSVGVKALCEGERVLAFVRRERGD